MSSSLSFWKHVPTETLGNIGDGLNSWYATHFPETASAADIASLKELSEQLAHRIAEIQGELEHDQQAVTEQTEKLNRDKLAAKSIGARLQSAQQAGDTAQVSLHTARLTKLADEIEKIGGPDGSGTSSGLLFLAQAKVTTDTNQLTAFKEGHAKTINDWTTADSRLAQNRSRMQQATEQNRQAAVAQAQAERDAGLLHRSQTGHVASDAMDKRVAALETETRAHVIQAQALQTVHAAEADVDSIVSEELAEQSAAQKPADKGNAALDRLARLTG